MIEANTIKQEVEDYIAISNIEQILPTPVASPNNKVVQQAAHDDDDAIDDFASPVPSTVDADARTKRSLKRRAATSKKVLDFSYDDYQAKRPRGRPPKTEPTKLSPAELKRLSPSDRRYYEMRLKNNEASRRSRLNRKGKEGALFDELAHLEAINQALTEQDIKLDRQIKSWEKKFIKLVKI